MAADTARGCWVAFKQFVRHLWKEEVVSLPRNLDDKTFKFDVPAKKIQVFTAAEIKAILAAAPDRTKLYILLALNCGLLARDMADLAPSEVNWTAGLVTRKRSKTKDGENVPTVTYKLWSPTLKLLKAERAKQGDRVLLGKNGNPVVTQRLKSNGTLTRTDTVRLSFIRAVNKANLQAAKEAKEQRQDVPVSISNEFRRLRRTGATLIANQFDDGLADLWLGHAPRGIGQRHYIAPSQKRLDSAVTWLGKHLGVASEIQIIAKANGRSKRTMRSKA